MGEVGPSQSILTIMDLKQSFEYITDRPGFSLPLILSKTQDLSETIMKEERNASSLGGRSMIALLIPSPLAFIYDYDYEYCQNYMAYLNNSIPELTFLFYAGGAIIRFIDFVDNGWEDLFILSYDLEVKDLAEPVVERIRKGTYN